MRLQVWNDTQTHFREANPKRVYYLSMEFLMGRSLLNALYNLDVKEPYTEALLELGYDLETLIEQVWIEHQAVPDLSCRERMLIWPSMSQHLCFAHSIAMHTVVCNAMRKGS